MRPAGIDLALKAVRRLHSGRGYGFYVFLLNKMDDDQVIILVLIMDVVSHPIENLSPRGGLHLIFKIFLKTDSFISKEI